MSKLKLKINTAAIVTVNNPALMSNQGRKKIADWLRNKAKELELYGKDLGKVYRTRYLYILIILLIPSIAVAQQNATSAAKVAWFQTATPSLSLVEANGLTYKYYPDNATVGLALTGVACILRVPPVLNSYDCSANFPAFTPGAHAMTITASNPAVESPKSISLTFTFYVTIPGIPTNVRIVPVQE